MCAGLSLWQQLVERSDDLLNHLRVRKQPRLANQHRHCRQPPAPRVTGNTRRSGQQNLKFDKETRFCAKLHGAAPQAARPP
jgi:hypothetical protein